MCKRGDVYYVDFGHNIESCKQSGIRPAVIVSNNRANLYSPVITVVPLTSRIHKKRSLPTHVYIPRGCGTGLPKSSMALADQVETIIPCHHPYPVEPEYIRRNLEDAVELKKGTLKGTKHPSLPCLSYRGKWTEFYYDK